MNAIAATVKDTGQTLSTSSNRAIFAVYPNIIEKASKNYYPASLLGEHTCKTLIFKIFLYNFR